MTVDCLKEVGEPPHEKTEESLQGMNKYKQVFRLRAVHLMAFFLFTYVGVEVTIGGWIVTFVINERGGGPSSGYISSGFFGGLTIGRVVLLPINKKVRAFSLFPLPPPSLLHPFPPSPAPLPHPSSSSRAAVLSANPLF